MKSASTSVVWLVENGPLELGLLLQSIPPAAHPPEAAALEDAQIFFDSEGTIAVWCTGASKMFGYDAEEAIGQNVTMLDGDAADARAKLAEEMNRALAIGHFGSDGWVVKKDGGRLWANALTMALKNEAGEPQGFARVLRDHSGRQDLDENSLRSRTRGSPIPMETTVAGIVNGEDGQVPEANDAFLALAGYTREDLLQGRLPWSLLTPPEYASFDELARQEALRFGACTPYGKELISKNGIRVPVWVVTAVLKVSPFRWITFVQDLRKRQRYETMEEEALDAGQEFGEIVGNSAVLRRVQSQTEVVAPTDATVLILGETGTGKELVVRAVHRLSPRRDRPLVTLNCAAIPTGLLESELFGYERGAFTGALSQKIGRFELAHRGTLFLDEVGDIPLELQPKLLRALQEKSFERLGGTRTIPIDVRLVAATNRDLIQMMSDKLFRSDLYYRLKVFPITLPPLRDRPGDIPILARHFVRKYAAIMSRKIERIPSDTMRKLSAYSWPGNVRELENFIERSVILSRGPALRAPLEELDQNTHALNTMNYTLAEVEREHISRVLRDCGGVVTAAAARLGMQRTTLNAMMKKLGISRKGRWSSPGGQ